MMSEKNQSCEYSQGLQPSIRISSLWTNRVFLHYVNLQSLKKKKLLISAIILFLRRMSKINPHDRQELWDSQKLKIASLIYEWPNKHMKGCSTSLVITGMQMMTMMRCHYTLLKGLKCIKLTTSSVGEDVEQLELSYYKGEEWNNIITLEEFGSVLFVVVFMYT